MRRTGILAAGLLAIVGLVGLTGGMAAADGQQVDGDVATNGVDNHAAATVGEEVTVTTNIKINYQGNNHLPGGTEVTFVYNPQTSSGVPAGATIGQTTVTIPSTGWDSNGDYAYAPVSVTLTPTAAGQINIKWRSTVDYGNKLTGTPALVIDAEDPPPPPADTTPPLITITTPADGGNYYVGQTINADYGCTDDESAVETCDGPVANGSPIDTATAGDKSFTVNASSEGGQSTATNDYTVSYCTDGSSIRQPINPDNSSVFSRGKSVPVKFGLCWEPTGGYTTSVTSTWKVVAGQVSCSTSSTAVNETDVATTSQASQYVRWSDGQYIYNADMSSKAAGTCWRIRVILSPTQSLLSAVFKLQK